MPPHANGEIGRITTAGQISRIHDPVAGGNIYQLTSSPDGSIWFLEGDGLNVGHAGRVGRVTRTGQISEFTLPQVDRGTHGVNLTADPAGNLWFTANLVHSRTAVSGDIGRITTS